MNDDHLEYWSIQQTGRQLVIELCQFALLLRLVALVFVVFSDAVPTEPDQILCLVAIGVFAVIGTYLMHRLVDSAPAHPLIVGIDVAIASLGLFLADGGAVFFVLSLFSTLLIGFLYRGSAAALLLSVLVLAMIAAGVSHPTVDVVDILSRSFIYVLTYAGGRVIAQRVEQLTDRSLAVSRQVASLEERSRMAREMHDGVVKTLHGIALSAQALGRAKDLTPELQRKFNSFTQAAEFGVQQARDTLVELRSGQDDRPLAVVIEDVVTRWSERARVEAKVTVMRIGDVDGDVRREVLACLREALDNIAEHAHAALVEVSLQADDRCATLAVSDDGEGIEQRRLRAALRQGHFGLRGMQERMSAVGGRCSVESTPGGGTTVRLAFGQPVSTIAIGESD